MLALILLLTGLFLSVFGARIIVDDANSSWTYSANWNAITPNSPCAECAAILDPTLTFNHTWHDTSGHDDATARLSFTGVSIEVYTICPAGLTRGFSIGTNFTFTLDSIEDGIFLGPQPTCAQYMYNYLVYARTNLSLGPHIFVIANNSPGLTSILLLDYAIYDDGVVATTSPTSNPPATISSTNSPSSHSSTTPPSHSSSTPQLIALGVIAGVLLIANILQFFWFRMLRSRKYPDQASYTVKTAASPVQQRPLLAASASPTSEVPSSFHAASSSDPAAPLPSRFGTGTGNMYTGAPMIMSASMAPDSAAAMMIDPRTRLEELAFTHPSAPIMSVSRAFDNTAVDPRTIPVVPSAWASQQPPSETRATSSVLPSGSNELPPNYQTWSKG